MASLKKVELSAGSGVLLPLPSSSSGVLQRTEIQVQVASFREVNIAENPYFRWSQYLADISVRGRVSQIVISATRTVWDSLREQVSAIETPHAGPTEEDGMLMVWDRQNHHLSIEILPSGRYDWFYRDRETDEYDGEEDLARYDFTPKFLGVLRGVWPSTTPDSIFPVVPLHKLVATGG